MSFLGNPSRIFVPVGILFSFICAAPAQNLFLLSDSGHEIQHYRIDQKGVLKEVKSYCKKDFPSLFPLNSIHIEAGNVLYTYGEEGRLAGRLHYDGGDDRLVTYGGDPGSVTDPGGRLLVDKDEIRRVFPGYVDVVKLEDQTFGVKEGKIDRVSIADDGGVSTLETALTLPESRLVSAATSPWGELFLSDAASHQIQRVVLADGKLKLNASLKDDRLKEPRGLTFSLRGDLFIALAAPEGPGIVRYSFKHSRGISMDDFSWSDYWGPKMDSTIDLQKQFLDIAVARPLGVLVSEATKPVERLSREQAGGHFGISQTVWDSPQTNSRDTIIALVEYEPGGHTGMHAHTDMEQSFYILSGRALFQIGEMEKEVGPGDLLFFPLNVKHSYQVLGDVPFKFLHLEWRDVR